MTERGRMRTWALAAAGLGVLGVGFLGLKSLGRKPGAGATTVKASAVTAASTLPQISAAIARGDGLALAVLKARLDARPPEAAPPDPAGQFTDRAGGPAEVDRTP